MLEEFEKNFELIDRHPALSEETKLDIQNYINKNIVSTLWVMAPAFDVLQDYPRIKALRELHERNLSMGKPGIIGLKKHV